jgi:hypothetical protein
MTKEYGVERHTARAPGIRGHPRHDDNDADDDDGDDCGVGC